MRRIKKFQSPRLGYELTPQQQTMSKVWEQYAARASGKAQIQYSANIFIKATKDKMGAWIVLGAPPTQGKPDLDVEGLALLVGMDANGAWNTNFFTDELWSFDGSERRQQIACLVFALGAAPLLPLREDAWPSWTKTLQEDLRAQPQHLALIRSLCEKLSPMFFEIVKQTYKLAEA
jgi:hypothetical protein